MKTSKVCFWIAILSIISSLIITCMNVKGAINSFNDLREITEKYNRLEEESSIIALDRSRLIIENKSLSESVLSLENDVNNLSEMIIELNNHISDLTKDNEELRKKIDDLEKLKSPTIATAQTNGATSFKSWMPYTAVTNTKSRAYNVISMSSPDENGLMKIDGVPLIAIGNGWGYKVGDCIKVTTTVTEFNAIVGDIKGDAETDCTRKYTESIGCSAEFIVDRSCLNSKIKSSGNVVSVLKQYDGIVINITKTGSILD